ncbi:MAG: AEC family transporter [Candidatus Fermentibacteraceae bacterium]|nr:AEC family transporter [Candidatus Fermentibacteraceae bacterium]
MSPLHQMLNAISVIMAIYLIALILRKHQILSEEHSLTFARLVTDVCLPAIVFKGLASQSIRPDQLEPAGLMLLLEITCISLAWAVTSLLGFSRSRQGAVVFCSAFGSSTFLGYSMVTQMYPGNGTALGEAVLISELGVGYPIFILGPVLAGCFGSERAGWKASLGFFRSPVFFALIGGLLWGILRLPGKDSALTAPLFHLADVLSGALTPLAIISVGLMFRRPRVRVILLPLAIVVCIKLLLKPLVAGLAASSLGFPEVWHDILVILAAMPPAVLGAVFLRRYGGDAELASTLLLTATLISVATLMAVFWLVGT